MQDLPLAGVRIDKWLWAARFFKTRTLAMEACDGGKVKCNTQTAKPSRIVKAGDTLEIGNEGGVYTVTVQELTDERGSAAIAQTLYEETAASKDLRAKVAEARRVMLAEEPNFARMKPTKRDRRLIHRFSGRD